MAKRLHSVAFTSGFLVDAKAEGMTEPEVAALVDLLSKNPLAGDAIVGSGGCRKVRLARGTKGKSSGYRVMTFFTADDLPVYVLSLLAKGSRANFSKAEIAMLAKATAVIADGRKTKA